MRKTILLVAMPNSIHVVRWVKQLAGQEWDIHLFASVGGGVVDLHPEMQGVTFHPPLWSRPKKIGMFKPVPSDRSIFCRVFTSLEYRTIGFLRRYVFKHLMPDIRVKQLLKVIDKIKPDLVHSMEIQAAGYLTLEAKKRYRNKFPSWLVTNWGSDIFLFGRLSEHKTKIRAVLESCDYYSCECERDVNLAQQFGFCGQAMPVFPNTGGFDLANLVVERRQMPASDRKMILLKGYQNWAGRALVGLRALSRCADILDGYSVVIYSAYPDVMLAAELFTVETGIPVRLIPNNASHQEILSLHAQARVSIGLSIGDAISTSFLEAVVMGSFPIQSCTACANEWIEHGVSGMIVPPEDPDIIEMAIRTALSDDELVNEAARINWQTALARLDGDLLKQSTADMYTKILQRDGVDASD